MNKIFVKYKKFSRTEAFCERRLILESEKNFAVKF